MESEANIKTIIGIDCSTSLKKVGICRTVLRLNDLVIEEVFTGNKQSAQVRQR
jgi:hypothetical protein